MLPAVQDQCSPDARDENQTAAGLRVVFCIHHGLDRNSGAPGAVMRLRDELRLRGASTHLLSFDDVPFGGEQMRAMLFPVIVAAFLLRNWRRFDIVDASMGDGAYAYPFLRRRLHRVTHSHGLEHLSARAELAEMKGQRVPAKKRLWRYGMRLWLVTLALRHSDVVMTLNSAEDRALIEMGITPQRIVRARQGVGDLVPHPNEDRRAGDMLTIVQVGSYTERKGIALTAAAMTRVMARHTQIVLRFIGTGCARSVVLADYPAALQDRIEVVPHFSNDQLPELVRDCAIQLLPSLFEGYVIAKLEGMRCGLALIVSDDPGTMEDVVDGHNGLVFPNGDAGALEMAIERLIVSPELLHTLAENGLAFGRGASWGAATEQRIALYRRLLAACWPPDAGA